MQQRLVSDVERRLQGLSFLSVWLQAAGQHANNSHELDVDLALTWYWPRVQLREMAAFALGRLAQNADNQAGIVQVMPPRPATKITLCCPRCVC
jgi:hypothetical protein